MQTVLIAMSIASASLAGATLGYWGLDMREQAQLAHSYRIQAGAVTQQEARAAFLLVNGIPRSVIMLALKYSLPSLEVRAPRFKIFSLQEGKLTTLIDKAGLAGKISLKGCALVRRDLSVALALAGALIGALFSELLAAILCVCGFVLGYRSLQSALEQEVEARTESVEKELSQLIEVLVLGLRSGLSFDRSLAFYCDYFSGSLSDVCQRMQAEWQHGLISREEGLEKIARSYDSSLLERIIESIKRSLRFGTSMAETLSNAGDEIRRTRKAKIEEKVAKAPVKMLIPIGVLILPAMLILILGPVLLELIEGF